MTTTISLTPQQTQQVLEQAQAAAQAIANSVTTPVGTNQFVFFAAFDGTDNAYVPVNGDTQNTAIEQLFEEVKGGNRTFQTASYYAGVGTPGTLSGSDWWPSDVTAQNIQTAQDAYDNFALTAFNFLQANHGGSVTSVIAGFSRGCAAEAIFAQMLYKNGLVYTDQNGVVHTLIQPGAVGAVSAALAIDPVLTGESGNMDFPPGVQNLTVVRAENEYRSLFKAADYGADSDNVIDAPGSHSDTGDAYDNGLGGIYLGAYSSFFQNAGLHTRSVDPTRQYVSPTATPIVVHSESLTDAQIAAIFATTGTLPAWEATYNPTNDLSVTRETTSYGSPVTVNQNATNFTAYDSNIVVGGSGYSSSSDFAGFVILPDSSASIGGVGDAITINNGATLDFTTNVITSNETIRFSRDSTKTTQNGTVIIDEPFAFRGTIYGLVPSDTIDLKGTGTATGATLATNNMLNVSNGNGNTVILQLDPTQNFGGDSFLIAPDGTGGTKIAAEDDSQAVSFAGTNETLLVVDPSKLSGTISNFAQGNTIDLAGVGTATSAVLEAGNILNVENGTGSILSLDFDPNQNFTNSAFGIGPDGAGGTNITLVPGYSFGSISAPGASYTAAYGLNNAGTVIGYYSDASGLHGFTESNNSFAIVPNISGSNFTWPSDINDQGWIVGQYTNSSSLYHAFQNVGGSVSAINVTGAKSVWAASINDSGQIVGYAADSIFAIGLGSFYSFIYSGGSVTTLTVAGASNTQAYAINDAGQVVGTYLAGTSRHGFLYQQGTPIQTIDVPGASSTQVFGINDTGQIVGKYSDSAGSHLFIKDGSSYATIDAPDPNDILSLSINDSGQITVYEPSGSGGFFVGASSFLGIPQIQCYRAGTRIKTPRGQTLIEELTIGDLVQTRFSRISAIKWIGRRKISNLRRERSQHTSPVRVIAGAFGSRTPQRDLWLSPDHAVFVEDVLIPIKHLINGCTITQEPCDEVTYYHVELEQHDVIFAEGLPAESYLDAGDRSNFENGGVPVRLHPELSAHAWESKACAPLIVTGPIVAAVRARLLQRAAKLAVASGLKKSTSRNSRAA